MSLYHCITLYDCIYIYTINVCMYIHIYIYTVHHILHSLQVCMCLVQLCTPWFLPIILDFWSPLQEPMFSCKSRPRKAEGKPIQNPRQPPLPVFPFF
jgi:hypothetical protein